MFSFVYLQLIDQFSNYLIVPGTPHLNKHPIVGLPALSVFLDDEIKTESRFVYSEDRLHKNHKFHISENELFSSPVMRGDTS